MNVRLTPELEKLVDEKVQSGRFNSASEVVREALRLMEERDQLLHLRRSEIASQIAEGLDSLDRGKGIDGTEAFRQLDQRHQRFWQRRKPA